MTRAGWQGLGWSALRLGPELPVLAWLDDEGWLQFANGHALLGCLGGLTPVVVAVDQTLADVRPTVLLDRVRTSHPCCYRVVIGPGPHPDAGTSAGMAPSAAVQRNLTGRFSWLLLQRALAEARLNRPLRQRLAALEVELDARATEQELQRCRHLAAWRFLGRGVAAAGSTRAALAPAQQLAALDNLYSAMFRLLDTERAAPVPLLAPVDLLGLVQRLAADLPVPVRWRGALPPMLQADATLLEDLLSTLLAGAAGLPGITRLRVTCRKGLLLVAPTPALAVTRLAATLEPFHLDQQRPSPACPEALLLPLAALQAQRQGLRMEVRRAAGLDGVLALVWPGETWPGGPPAGL